ncbi:MAG: class I SAM-dependent methyltransferase [Candidatus Omnitrophica bacterium]|nr:class I SAM-dependent methyltransferase [Candidatus Omnitrophota bacterium]
MTVEKKSSLMCMICKTFKNTFITQLKFPLLDQEILTDIYKCHGCGSYFRQCSYMSANMKSHFTVAGYNQLERENELFIRRQYFFEFIVTVMKRFKQEAKTVLDIGTGFGHFLKILKNHMYDVSGIELEQGLYQRLKQDGMDVYKFIKEIPLERKYDIITMIDTLYYMDDPLDYLKKLREYLAANGLLIIRIANRVPILNFRRLCHLPITHNEFVDHKYHFSMRAIKLLMKNSGYKIKKIIFTDQGKMIGNKKQRRNLLLLKILNLQPFVKLYPGVFLICE